MARMIKLFSIANSVTEFMLETDAPARLLSFARFALKDFGTPLGLVLEVADAGEPEVHRFHVHTVGETIPDNEVFIAAYNDPGSSMFGSIPTVVLLYEVYDTAAGTPPHLIATGPYSRAE